MPLEELSRAWYPPHIPKEIAIPEWRGFDLVAQSVERYPDRAALVFAGRILTYRQLWDYIGRTARALADRGVKPGDRVALMLPNCPQYVMAYYGALLLGAIVTQINPLLVERELQLILADSGAETIIALDAVMPRVKTVAEMTQVKRQIMVSFSGAAPTADAEDFARMLDSASGPYPDGRAVSGHDIAVLQYTGGTTGQPKGAVLTHRNLVANVLQMDAFNEFLPGEEVVLGVLPLFHVYGMTVCLNLAMYEGATVVLMPRFDIRDVVACLEAYPVTLWPGVPTMYVALLQWPNLDPKLLKSIRQCNSGSAPMPTDVLRQFEERTGAAVLEGYGLSEASPVTHSHAPWMTRRPGTVGIAIPSTQCRIVDPATLQDLGPGELGELWVRGPQVMQEYWNHPKESAETLVEGGWLRTGDLATVDSEGYLTIMDRLKDLIIASGYNVYPREVEEVLYSHPDVVEAVVVGAPDAYRGETVRAVVVPRPGSGLNEAALRDYLASQLAAYKRPTIIELRETLPKSAVGKILRREVRKELSGS
jgi:long-chain acyl-CoA synthetase